MLRDAQVNLSRYGGLQVIRANSPAELVQIISKIRSLVRDLQIVNAGGQKREAYFISDTKINVKKMMAPPLVEMVKNAKQD